MSLTKYPPAGKYIIKIMQDPCCPDWEGFLIVSPNRYAKIMKGKKEKLSRRVKYVTHPGIEKEEKSGK